MFADTPAQEDMNLPETMAVRIWLKQEIISQSLRNLVEKEMRLLVSRLKLDKLSRRQMDLLIAVRHLCHSAPDGIPLAALARHLGVSNPSASVMVDSLVEPGFLIRRESPTDRRTKRIRLADKIEQYFLAGDNALQSHILALAREVGDDFLGTWLSTLERIEQKLPVAGLPKAGQKPLP